MAAIGWNSLSFCKLVGIVVGLSFVDYYYQTLPQVKDLESLQFYHHTTLCLPIQGCRGGIHPSFVLSGTVAALMEHSFYILVD